MLRVRVYDNGKCHDGDERLLDLPGAKWIDVQEPTEAVLNGLATKYGLHRLAIEDCLHLDQRPKIEDYGSHHFVVLQGFTAATDSWDDLTLHEVHFFLGPDWLITVHDKAHEAIAAAHTRIDADPAGTLGRGVDFVMYLIADALVDRHFALLDCFNDELEAYEESIFSEYPQPSVLQEIFKLKRALVLVRRVMSPQRDVMGALARRGLPQIQERTTPYFRDVADHLVRIAEQMESARDLVASVVEAYLSQVANRTAEVSKQLTVFASIFLPLSFIVGFFGQNFEVLGNPAFFWVMLASMVILPLSTILWFRHKGWF